MSSPPPSSRPRIRSLPKSLAAQLWAGRTVSSYSSAASLLLHSAVASGARRISLAIHPAALRLTCTDDTGLPRSPPPALSIVASVDVVSRSALGTVSVRGTASADDAQALLPKRGKATVVDVWELFLKLPVRRRAAAEIGERELSQEVRMRLVAVACAYPSVDFRLECGQGGLAVFESVGEERLGMKRVQDVLGCVAAEGMVQVRARYGPVSVEGFMSREAIAIGPDEGQIVSIDGVTLSPFSFLHKAVRAVWKGHNPARGKAAGPLLSSRRRPAFVLNFNCNEFCADVVFSGGEHADVRFHDSAVVMRCVEAAVAKALHVAVRIQRPGSATAGPMVSSRFVEGCRPSIVKPFRVKKRPPSGGSSSKINPEIEAALSQLAAPPPPTVRAARAASASRPRTAPSEITSASLAVRARLGRNMGEGCAPVIRRPKSASEIQLGFQANAPSWNNPCFESRGTNLAPVVGTPLAAFCTPNPNREHVLDMRRVRITRSDICKLRVVGQSDLKFIIVVDEGDIMYAVDQHAASERARFERLQRKLRLESVPPATATFVSLSSCQSAALENHLDHIQRWGWKVEPVSPVRHQIAYAPYICETEVHIDRVEHLVAYLDTLARGSAPASLPRPILDALASVSCHSAVRFGDKLTHEQCVSIVRALEECEIPFNCAHGRPSIVPLVVL